MLNKIAAKTDLGYTADYYQILSNSQAIHYVADFMLRTGLLGQFRHVEYEAIDANEDVP